MRTTALILLATLVAAPAAAQHQGHGQGHGQDQGPMRQQGQMMMQMGQEQLPGPLRVYGVFAPAKVLEGKDALALTADQTARITTVAEWAKTAHDQAHAPAHAAMMAARDELQKPTPNLDLVREMVVAHATAEGNMQWVQLSAALQVRALLTDAQRDKLTAK